MENEAWHFSINKRVRFYVLNSAILVNGVFYSWLGGSSGGGFCLPMQFTAEKEMHARERDVGQYVQATTFLSMNNYAFTF